MFFIEDEIAYTKFGLEPTFDGGVFLDIEFKPGDILEKQFAINCLFQDLVDFLPEGI